MDERKTRNVQPYIHMSMTQHDEQNFVQANAICIGLHNLYEANAKKECSN